MARPRVSLAAATSKGLVLDLIRAQGPISRVALAETTGLTQATMSTVVRQLMSEGLVIATGRGESTGGKPPVMLDVNRGSRFAVGLQLGRESNTYVVIDLGGAIVGRTRTPGIGTSEPAQMVARVADEIDRTLAGLGIAKAAVVGVGVVAPGPLDLARGVVRHAPQLEEWIDVPIRSMLFEAVGLPVILDNDATAAAIGDFWGGNLDGAVSHATVYMGTGIGSGVLLNGTVFRGASSNAGEVGQVVTTDEHGARVVIEDVADAHAIVLRARARGEFERLGLGGSDDFEDFRTVASAAIKGDEGATELIEYSADRLADGVLAMANLFDLDSVSLAGPAFAVVGSIYLRVIQERLDGEFFARSQHGIRVRMSTDVADAAAVGGAALVLQNQFAPRTLGFGEVPR